MNVSSERCDEQQFAACKNKKRIILAITGASGSILAIELLRILSEASVEVHGIISDAGRKVLSFETGHDPEDLDGVGAWHDIRDFAAPMSSGSADFSAMIVLPCSMGTLASIACGISQNLIHRAADVTLKEKRPLILAVRETPFNKTHLVNMLKVHDAGATIFPVMPSFYHKPKSVPEIARNFAARIADSLGVQVAGMKRWPESAE